MTHPSEGIRSSYTPEMGDRIAALLRDGLCVAEIGRMDGMPKRSTIFQWAQLEPDFVMKYREARAIGYETQAEEVHEWEDKIIKGEIDPQAGVAAGRLRQWRLAKALPKRFGDSKHMAVEHNVVHQVKRVVLDVEPPKELESDDE